MRRRRRCRLLHEVLADPALPNDTTESELGEIVRAITGRELSSRVVGQDPKRVSLTDLFEEGVALARPVLARADRGEAVLEFAGGIGQVGHAVAPHVGRLVSVDEDPRAAAYGSVLAAGVEFRSPGDVPADEVFDGAYAIGAFGRLPAGEWEGALGYLHGRLAPGAWLLLNPPGPGPEFRAVYEPLFRGLGSPVRDGSLLLEKRAGEEHARPAAPGDRWAVREASVAADVLHDEVVVVDLDKGAYYVLEGSASVIWQMLAAGQTVPAIAATLSEWHPEHASGMEAAVSDFTAQLAGEGLLVPAEADRAHLDFDPGALRTETPFKAPEMFRYTEMEALIQMDPIREYDETGWPRRPAARTPRM